MKETILALIKKVREMYPYKDPNDRDSYSEYNQAWEDACDMIEQDVEDCDMWISVEDKLPDYDEWVLAVGRDLGNAPYEVACYHCEMEEKRGGHLWLPVNVSGVVTHWQPLPETPKEKQ